MNVSYDLTVPQWGKMKEKIEGYNASLKKAGMPPITFTESYYKGERANLWYVLVPCQCVRGEISGEPVYYDGWELLGTVDELGVCRSVPGHSIPEQYREYRQCDHCNKNRNRKKYVILRHKETGETRSIGSACVKDFLPQADVAALVAMFANYEELERELREERGRRAPNGEYAETVVATSLAWARAFGWVTAKMGGQSGRECGGALLVGKFPEGFAPNDEDSVKAKQIIEWVKGLPGKSEYETNLKIILSDEWVRYQDWGFVFSAHIAYNKAMSELEARKAEASDRKPSEFVGQCGKRDKFRLICRGIIAFDGQWGTSVLHKLEDEAGNKFSWFSSGPQEWIQEGEWVSLKGTVKQHKLYNETKQTILTRCVPA